MLFGKKNVSHKEYDKVNQRPVLRCNGLTDVTKEY